MPRHSIHCEHRVEFLLTPLQPTAQGYSPDFWSTFWSSPETRNSVFFMLTRTLYFPCQPVVSVNGCEEQGMLVAMAIIIITCICGVPFRSVSLVASLLSLPDSSYGQTPINWVTLWCILAHSPLMACGVSGIIFKQPLLVLLTIRIVPHNRYML